MINRKFLGGDVDGAHVDPDIKGVAEGREISCTSIGCVDGCLVIARRLDEHLHGVGAQEV